MGRQGRRRRQALPMVRHPLAAPWPHWVSSGLAWHPWLHFASPWLPSPASHASLASSGIPCFIWSPLGFFRVLPLPHLVSPGSSRLLPGFLWLPHGFPLAYFRVPPCHVCSSHVSLASPSPPSVVYYGLRCFPGPCPKRTRQQEFTPGATMRESPGPSWA